MSSFIPAFYNAGLVNIWVEDALTRDYFTAVWPDAPFHFIVAGGIAGAKAMAKRAKDDHLPVHVFAIVDRDLGEDNEAKWEDQSWDGIVYRPRVLEVENFLLDEEAIAQAPGNAKQMTAAQVRGLLIVRAEKLKWWMTCKRVLAEVNAIRNQNFPADHLALPDRPDGGVSDEDAAVNLLLKSDWKKNTLPGLQQELEEPQLRARVRTAHAEVTDWVAADAWRERFSGKELYEWVYGQISQGRNQRQVSKESLAAEIGALQLAGNRVPASLTALKNSIRRRTGV